MEEIRVEKRYYDSTERGARYKPRVWEEVPEHSARANLSNIEWFKLLAKGTASNRFAEYRIIQEGGGVDEYR